MASATCLHADIATTTSVKRLFVDWPGATPSIWRDDIHMSALSLSQNQNTSSITMATQIAGFFALASGVSLDYREDGMDSNLLIVFSDEFEKDGVFSDEVLKEIEAIFSLPVINEKPDTGFKLPQYDQQFGVEDNLKCVPMPIFESSDDDTGFDKIVGAIILINSAMTEAEIDYCLHSRLPVVFGVTSFSFSDKRHFDDPAVIYNTFARTPNLLSTAQHCIPYEADEAFLCINSVLKSRNESFGKLWGN